tara:strand:+ start:2444 stop:2821 length:378 start_codon:yes stop_codon:yes gene_type:complete
LFQFIRSIESELVAYNVATLRDDSQDVNGKPIGFYSRATELITGGRKKKGDPFDLLDTGKLLDSLFVKVQTDSLFFGNKDPKLKEVLKNTISDDLFGLQEDDLNKVLETRVLPYLLKYYTQKLGI